MDLTTQNLQNLTMNEIITTLEALRPALCSRTMNQLICIIDATLAMTGRVTMLQILLRLCPQ